MSDSYTIVINPPDQYTISGVGQQGIAGPAGAAVPIAANSILGNNTGATANPSALTGPQVLALIGAAPSAHTHLISEVTGLQAQLDALGAIIGGTNASLLTSGTLVDDRLTANVLLKSGNLSGLASLTTSRTNLGLGNTDSPAFAGLSLSAAAGQSPYVVLDRSAVVTSASNISEIQPLYKSNNLGGGPSFYQWQGTYQDGPGGNWNETMTVAWNRDCSGLVKTQRPGIGWTLESGYDHDQDGTNPLVEAHMKYWKPTSGTEVRIESHTINPGANTYIYYMTTDSFGLRDNSHSDQEFFGVSKDSVGRGQLLMLNESVSFRIRCLASKTYELGNTESNPYTAGARLGMDGWGRLDLPGLVLTNNGSTKAAELTADVSVLDNLITIGGYAAKLKQVTSTSFRSNKVLIGDLSGQGNGDGTAPLEMRSLGFSPTLNTIDVRDSTWANSLFLQKEDGSVYLGTVSRSRTTALLAAVEIGGSVVASGSVTASNLTGTNTGDNAVNTLYSGLVSNATHTGDATGATALTLAIVNSNVGSFGSATQSAALTVNSKGLITAASASTITPAVGSITGFGTGVATMLAINLGSSGASVARDAALGTPLSGTLTNCTGLPVAGITGLGSLATQSGTFSGTSSGSNSGDQDLSAAKKRGFGVTFDGGGSVPTTGKKNSIRIPVACTITKATIIGDLSGSSVVDVRKSTYSSYPTTGSIAASAKPTLSSAQKSEDSTLTGWTTAITAGDMLEFVLDSVTTITAVTVMIEVAVT